MIFCVSGKREATHQAGEDGGQGGAEAREQGITEGKMQIELWRYSVASLEQPIKNNEQYNETIANGSAAIQNSILNSRV